MTPVCLPPWLAALVGLLLAGPAAIRAYRWANGGRQREERR